MPGPMHADEFDIDEALVRRLLAAQFPAWTQLGLKRMPSTGTDNAIFRLGPDLAVRLPRRPAADGQAEKDALWLPRLAPHLPVAIPLPVALGEPSEAFAWRWSVCPWLPGAPPAIGAIADPVGLAKDLAGFIRALRVIDPAGGPPPGRHNFGRGVPLVQRDQRTREAIGQLRGIIDTGAASAAWETALAAPVHTGAPNWIHGDICGGNVLVVEGRLSGVIDFGGLAVGDPACDLIVAWNLLPTEGRDVFRAELAADDAAWARGRGWALSIALLQLPYYNETNPGLAANATATIAEILRDAA